MDYLKQTLRKICQNTGFLCPFFPISGKYFVVYGKIRVGENPYFGIFYAVRGALRTLSKIHHESFCENSSPVLDVNYFLKKLHRRYLTVKRSRGRGKVFLNRLCYNMFTDIL